jgi:pullulanase/glycogen debranching enzyme
MLCRLRQRQMRNFSCALLLSHGIPMLQMGDEYGHSKKGNNNTYCHDSELNWVDWQQATLDDEGFARFVRRLIHFRWGLEYTCCCCAAAAFAAIK